MNNGGVIILTNVQCSTVEQYLKQIEDSTWILFKAEQAIAVSNISSIEKL